MHAPNDRIWQKEHKIFYVSHRTERAKPNCGMTTRQLVHQALTNDASCTTHQGITEPGYDIDNPNPLRTPTCDLIDYYQHLDEVKGALKKAVNEHTHYSQKLSQMTEEIVKMRQKPVTDSTQQ